MRPSVKVVMREFAHPAGSPKQESSDAGTTPSSAVKFAHTAEAHSICAQSEIAGENNSVHTTDQASSRCHTRGTRIRPIACRAPGLQPFERHPDFGVDVAAR